MSRYMDTVRRQSFRWLLLLGLGFALLLSSFDLSGMNLALVWLEKDLCFSHGGIDWIVNAYLIAFASCIVPAGRLSDIFGSKRMLFVGFMILILSLVGSALSQMGWQIIFFRGVQGIGCACCLPATLSSLFEIFEPEKIGLPMGILLAIGSLGLVIGPIFSGFLLESTSLSVLLWWQVPLAVLALCLTVPFLPSTRREKKNTKVDLWGAILLVAFLGTLFYGLDLLGKMDVKHLKLYGAFACSLGLLWLFVVCEDNSKYPLISFHQLADREFILGIVLRFCTSFAFFSILFLTTYSLIHISIEEATTATLVTLPLSLTLALSLILGGLLYHKVSNHLLIRGTLYFTGLGLILLSLATFIFPTRGIFYLASPLLAIGFGIFFVQNTLRTFNQIPSSYSGVGMAILYLVSLCGASAAITLASYLLQTPGFSLVVQLLQSEQIPLSEMNLSLLQSVMSGMSSIPDALLQFANHSKEVYLAIQTGFISIMSLDLALCGVLILVPLWVHHYLLRTPRQKAN